MAGPHDIGGLNFGPIKFDGKKTLFDKRVDVLQRLLGLAGAKVYRVDELRRSIENIPEKEYYNLSYYQRWIFAMKSLLVEKGVLEEQEIEKKLLTLKVDI
tara:strand:- start:231 stop:530 length:300 start_codon:yes stop_codon:yes gene_type:complete